MRGPLTTYGVESAYSLMSTTPEPFGSRSPIVPSASPDPPSTVTLESRLTTSIRKPSMPRSSHQFIIWWTSARGRRSPS